MKRRLLLFFAAIGAVVILWALFGGQTHRFTLADGTTLTVHAVSAGVSNRYCFGNPAKRLAAKLPWPWAQKSAANAVLTAPVDGRTNLVIWVTYRGTAPRAGRPFRFRCVHDGGTNEFAFNGITKYGLPSGEAGAAFYTAFWPRRSKRLTLQALEEDAPPGAKPLWEVRVANPLPLDYPQWEPEVLPACRTVENVTICLEQLVPSETRLAARSAWPPLDAEAVRARLRVTRGGQPDDDWEICGVCFRDALGQRFQQLRRLKSRSNAGMHDLDFVLPLLAGERAGKLGVAFVRAQGFPTNELFALPELELPAAGQHVSKTLRTNSPFGEVSIHVIAHTIHVIAHNYGFDVSVLNRQPPGHDLAASDARWFQPLAATDDRGRSYSFAAFGPLDDIGSATFHRIRVSADAKRLLLTLAVTRMILVEYTVGRESMTRPK